MLKKDNLLWCMENSAGDIEITELYVFKLHNFCWNTLLDHHAISCKGWWTKHWPPVHGPRWTIQVNCLKIDQPSKILFYLSSIESSVFYIFLNKMFKEMRAAWLVRTSPLYSHKARDLRHTSALLRYNTRSLRHQYERALFTIPFTKEIKKNLFLEHCWVIWALTNF